MTIPELRLAGPTVTAAAPLGEPIVARNVADQVVERLVTAVALGVYVPGQCLPSERELAPSQAQTEVKGDGPPPSPPIFTPFTVRGMTLSNRVQAQTLAQDAPSLLIACGLALRSFD